MQAGYANHSEIIVVPMNLVSKFQQCKNRARILYNHWCIALQGCRLSKPLIGENFLVIDWD